MNAPTARCLQLLLEKNGKIISREEFLDTVWKTRGVVVSQNTFYQNISLLRKSLLKAGLSQDIIVTVRQRGFVLASGSQVSSFFRADGAEFENPLNIPVITDVLPPPVEKKIINNIIDSKDVRENVMDNKKIIFKLPGWVLTLLVIMVVANILSLFW